MSAQEREPIRSVLLVKPFKNFRLSETHDPKFVNECRALPEQVRMGARTGENKIVAVDYIGSSQSGSI